MNEENLPWTEKYRPKNLSMVVGQENVVKRLKAYSEFRNVPNILMSGPPGVGKTSCAVALAYDLFGEQFERNFLELNASDERGINVVRSTIKDFARTLALNSKFKIIFLDESDALTSDAQQALRRTMEKYTKTCRFLLSCNYSSRIIEPLQSRCVVFRFKPLTSKQIDEQVKFIARKEDLKIDNKVLEAVNYVCEGDLRRVVNLLQSAASISNKITDSIIFEVASRAKPVEVKEMLLLALKKEFLKARDKLDVLLFEHGMSGEDVILQMYKELLELDESIISSKKKIDLIDKIGEYNFRIVEGSNERIQLEALLAQFMKE
ncbi:MAG: replication factor C small subunit [archaeon]